MALFRDYKHASKIFVDGNYRLSPKYGFLFHVAFDLANNSRLGPSEQLEMGLMVKQVNLPKFSVDTKTYNAYNRPNIIQTKIKYDPVSITFHDDSADIVRDFWYDYMSLYYRDSDYTLNVYQSNHKYAPRLKQDWGYKVSRYNTPSGQPERMLNAIRIYSLHQKRFTEYVLVNPTITGFQHGEHQTGSNDTMAHTMTVTYETVLYNYGYIAPDSNTNFATLHYDNYPSPLNAPTANMNVVDQVEHTLSEDNSLTKSSTFSKVPGSNLGANTGEQLLQIGGYILNNGYNPTVPVNIYSLSGLAGIGMGSGVAGLTSKTNSLGLSGISGLSTQFNGQRGGPYSPTGATPVSSVAATAATKISSTDTVLFNGGSGGVAGSRTVQSNGENIGGTSAAGTNVPATPVQRLSDGSLKTVDPVTNYQYIKNKDGLTSVTDSSGILIKQTDIHGVTLYEIDPATGEPKDVSAGQLPSYSDAQKFSGASTNINTYAGNDGPINQGTALT